jgi:hypothetical protein
VSGLALVAGALVRPIAFIYAFLLWTFVIALPVTTTPGVEVSSGAILAPAMLVQVRDIALSAMMFVLLGLGAGIWSVDRWWSGGAAATPADRGDVHALLLRLALGVPLVVGGASAGMDHFVTFDAPSGLLIALGALALGGVAARWTGLAIALLILTYMAGRLDLAASLIANLNAIKREIALVAAALVLAHGGAGSLYRIDRMARDLARRIRVRATAPGAT